MTLRKLLLGAAVALLMVPPVDAAEQTGSAADDPETYRLLNLFGDVFERVRADYVEKITDKQLIEAAISGMLSSLDPHSSFMNADGFREMQVQTKGEFGGLGIEVTMENGVVKVVSPIDDTPAYRAKLEPGDLITHLDGEPVVGMTLAQAVEKMRGRVGSNIRLTIRRDGREPFDVTLTRAVIKIKSVRARLEGKVGYLRISSFSEQTDEGVKDAIARLKKEAGGQLQGLVIDLRNNPGGLLSQAVAVSDEFLDKGEIVSTGARRGDDAQRFNAKAGDLMAGLPIVVLVNAGSASASEIVAGALQDHKRAILLGTKSFGKGSVQTVIPISNYGAIRLTTARYYTPSGRSIQAVGIEPDIVVEQARIEEVNQPKRRREGDLPKALDRKGNGDAGKAAPEGKAPPESKTAPDDEGQPEGGTEAGAKKADGEDYQLLRALDLIRGIALYAEKVPAETAKTATPGR